MINNVLDLCVSCVPPDQVFPLMVGSAIAGWITGIAATKLGEAWKRRNE